VAETAVAEETTRMGRKPEISAAMTDPSRSDYGLRISRGNMLRFKGNVKLLDKFPLGCRVEVSILEGHYRLALTNHPDGKTGNKVSIATGEAAEFALTDNYYSGAALPEFGAVAPLTVNTTPRGILVELPDTLPPLWNKKAGVTKEQAAGPAGKARQARPPAPAVAATPAPGPLPQEAPAAPEQVSAAPAAPAPQPAPAQDYQPHEPELQQAEKAGQEEQAAVLSEPTISLRHAVRAVNQWKRLYPDKTALSLLEDGTLRVFAEYD